MNIDDNYKLEFIKELFKDIKNKYNIKIQLVVEKFRLVFFKLSKNIVSDDDKALLVESILKQFLAKGINCYDAILVENNLEILNIKGKESKFFTAVYPLFNDYFQFLCKIHKLNGIDVKLRFDKITGNIAGFVNISQAMLGNYEIILSTNHTFDTMLKKFAYEFTHIKQVIRGELRIDATTIYWNDSQKIHTLSIDKYKKHIERKRKNINVKNEYKFPWSIECELNQKHTQQYFASKQHKEFMLRMLVEASTENYTIIKSVVSSFK